MQWCWRLALLQLRGSTCLSANWHLIRWGARSPAVSRARRSTLAIVGSSSLPEAVIPFLRGIPLSDLVLVCFLALLYNRGTRGSSLVRRSRTVSRALSSTALLKKAAWGGVLRQVRGCLHAALPWVQLWHSFTPNASSLGFHMTFSNAACTTQWPKAGQRSVHAVTVPPSNCDKNFEFGHGSSVRSTNSYEASDVPTWTRLSSQICFQQRVFQGWPLTTSSWKWKELLLFRSAPRQIA